ncbi:MAG: hypothetical protein DSY89_09290 [Deltaproteobacteria bacterium]|nr:MAG: hypothetical protein DSY89_09290 [Deltaproteobacteria bacterium]
MIVIPNWKALTVGLYSDFVDIKKLVQYYQGVDGNHGIHFKSVSTEGILYYDHFDYLGGGLQSSAGKELDTVDVTRKLIRLSADNSFSLTVYRIDPDDIYFWASLFDTRPLYKDLKSEFTNLASLIKKMKAEGLTGYIETFFEGELGGAVFFRSGQVIHSACFIDEKLPERLPARDRVLAALLYFSQKKSGVFNVREIASTRQLKGQKEESDIFNAHVTSRMLESLLKSLKGVMAGKNGHGFDFNILLKKKFIKKADKYRFLDPFAAEFQYTEGKVVYHGDADWKQVAAAIFESARELAEENQLAKQFDSEIEIWKAQYAKELTELGYDE